MHYDDVIRIQSSINRNHLEELSQPMEYLRIHSELKDLQKSIMPLYSSSDMRNTVESLKVLAQANAQILTKASGSYITQMKELQNAIGNLCDNIIRININGGLKSISDSMRRISLAFGNYNLLHISYNEPNEETDQNEEIDSKIVSEIFSLGQENKKESGIITLSPVNDRVLKYLSENPEEFYRLDGKQFEIVMEEIYRKLGYKVERTQVSRDGGKDIIIRKPEILGDFIYYVECKRHSIKRPIGVGILRNLITVVNTDRVNGGILATTSYFTRDAKKYIDENKYGYQIQMHDFDTIRSLLNKAI
jgi:restriction endonuclease Mrr